MKRTLTLALALVAMVALGGRAAAQQYSLHFPTPTSEAIADGDTVVYTPTEDEWEMDGVTFCNIYINNLTSDDLSTLHEVELVDAPAGTELEICAGGQCPWDEQPYTLQPGVNDLMPITVELQHLSSLQVPSVVVRVKVGNSRNLEGGSTAYVRFNLVRSTSGIGTAEAEKSLPAYPNPTRGRVTVNGQQHDLSGMPAGVYTIDGQIVIKH